MNLTFRIITTIFICLAFPYSSMAGSSVVGCCSSTGEIATPQEVNLATQKATKDVNLNTTNESTLIQSKIEQVGKVLGTELQKNRSSNEKLIENQNNQIRNLLVEYGTAKEKIEAEKTFGPQSRLDTLCDEPEIGGRIQAGLKAETEVTKQLGKDIRTHNTTTRTQKEKAQIIEKVPFDTINSEALFPANKTLTKEAIKNSKNVAQLITNPEPISQLSDKEASDMGKEFENSRKIIESRLIVPQLVFNKNIAAHSPSVPLGDQAIELHKKMGGSGKPEDVGVVDGMVSPYAMLDLMVNSRFSNPNWYAEISEKNQTALMRELLAMEATSMEMQKRQLELTQLMALLLAQDTAGQAEKALSVLSDKQGSTIKSKNKEN